MGIRSWGSGFRLWRPVSTHFSVNWVGSFKSSHMGISAQELGSRLWASGEQTLLGIELCILFQVNSPRGSVHGIQDFASVGRAASTHCSVNCVCNFRSIGFHGIWNFASGYPGIKHCLALNCICSCRVNSLQGSVDGIRDFCLWVSG